MRSTSVRMDAPVVVKPLTVSKNASGKLDISPLVKNGRQPASDANSHVSAATARLSRTDSGFPAFRVGKNITAPSAAAAAAPMRRSSVQPSE